MGEGLVSRALERQLGDLRAFGQLVTRGHGDAERVLLTFLRELASQPAPSLLEIYRAFHERLRALPELPFAADCDLLSKHPGLHDYCQLTRSQRATVFLVIGRDFSFDDAAFILQKPREWLEMDVIAALMLIEHVIPVRDQDLALQATALASARRGRWKATTLERAALLRQRRSFAERASSILLHPRGNIFTRHS